MRFTRRALLALAPATCVTAGFPAVAQITPRTRQPGDTDWLHYANDLASTRYVPLDQINAENFSELQVAWRFKTDALSTRLDYQLRQPRSS